MTKDLLITNIMSVPVVSITKTTNLKEIKQTFADNSVHHLPVMDNNNVIGMVTSQDVHVAEIINARVDSKFDETKILAEDIMSNKLISIAEDASVKVAAEYFVTHKVHSLPVIENQKLIGIVTTYDLMKVLAKM